MGLKKAAAFSLAAVMTAVVVPLSAAKLADTAKKIANADSGSLVSRAAYGSYAAALGKGGLLVPYPSPQTAEDKKRQLSGAGRAGALISGKMNAVDILLSPDENERHTGTLIPTPLPAEDVLGALPYINDETRRDGIITRYTFTDGDTEQFFTLTGGSQVRNCTDYDNAFLLELSRKGLPFSLESDTDKPQVLIYHTHATESFERTARDAYDSSFSCKTTERDMSIIAVGDEICRSLTKAGVSVLHDTLVHDYPSYDAAYDSSRQTVKELLEQYPSIKIVLDIHRDGIERESGERLAPCCEIDGKNAAQIMIISCAGDENGDVPEHALNFRFACALQDRIEADYPELCRPMLFDYRFYNQDLSTGALLIEVGSQANSIDEVKYTGSLLGSEIAALIEGS